MVEIEQGRLAPRRDINIGQGSGGDQRRASKGLCGDAEERSHTARVELGIGISGGDRRRTTKGRD